MTIPALKVHRLDAEAPLPSRALPGDAGLDISSSEDVVLEPGERRLVRTGLAFAVPDGHAAFVHPRSGLAARHGISVVNAPGTIDAGYRGEVMVNLINLGTDIFTISRGDRIAQVVIQRVELLDVVEVDTAAALGESERGVGGHGHTGVSATA